MTDQLTEETDLPRPFDGINPEECMDVLLDPLSDLVLSIKSGGVKLLTMLLRHEYQRGFAAGQLAATAARSVLRPVEHGQPVGYVVKTHEAPEGKVTNDPRLWTSGQVKL